MTDEQISALLRLKRYEQPPEGYFDQLLQDVHRRQRSELLRQSLWQIAGERIHTFFGIHSMGSLSYTGAMAAFLVMGVAAIGLMTPGDLESVPGTRAIASTRERQPAPEADVFALQPTAATLPVLSQSPVGGGQSFHSSRLEGGRAPRYIIDARPATYEPQSNF